MHVVSPVVRPREAGPLSPPVQPLEAEVLCTREEQDDHTAVLIQSFAAGALPLRDLSRLSCTCAALHAASAQLFTTLNLSSLPSPEAFFRAGVADAPRFQGVTSLTIQFCSGLRDEHLSLLPPSVCQLTLDGCPGITDKGIKVVSQRCGRTLELLSLYCATQLTDSSCTALSLRCPSLTSLSLSGCHRIGTAGVLVLASRCRKLRLANLTRVRQVDDMALTMLATANPHIEELRLFAASQYTDAPIVAVAQHCHSLRTLDLTGVSRVGDPSLLALGAHCPLLSHLILSWCTEVGDEGVCATAAGCPLESLSLHGSRRVTQRSVDALAEHCASTLTSIDIRGCSLIAQRAPTELIGQLPRLREFVLAS